MTIDPDWTAQQTGHEWRDDELMLAVAWLKSFVPRAEMEQRLDRAKAVLLSAREKMREGFQTPLYDASDTAAWYILQAETYALNRAYWTPEGAMRVVPFLTRIGKELPLLMSVTGVEERAARLMLSERKQPDSGIFELLVALAYRRGGWKRVEFVPEKPGRERTPDIHVFRPGSRWAVECKRLSLSPYALKEKSLGTKLAEPVHALSLETGESIVVEIVYKVELIHVPGGYLENRVHSALRLSGEWVWDDEVSAGVIRPVNWRLARRVLSKDFVYFGSTRMIELLSGQYAHEADHSMAAKWRPWEDRPEYADAVYHASVVTWWSTSQAATSQKGRHFRKTLSDAEGQLPTDRPGVIHVGVESYAGTRVDAFRHFMNRHHSQSYKPKNPRMRWVYGNYFVPEATTRKDESWAITETMVPYKIGSHRTRWPLPDHMLVSSEGPGRGGMHWDGRNRF